MNDTQIKEKLEVVFNDLFNSIMAGSVWIYESFEQALKIRDEVLAMINQLNNLELLGFIGLHAGAAPGDDGLVGFVIFLWRKEIDNTFLERIQRMLAATALGELEGEEKSITILETLQELKKKCKVPLRNLSPEKALMRRIEKAFLTAPRGSRTH